MKFKIQMILEDETNQTHVEDIIQLEKNNELGCCVGLSLQESKQLLKQLQQRIVLHQAKNYTKSHRNCHCCSSKQRIKGYENIQYKTLFGTVVIPNLRLYKCSCDGITATKTFSILTEWLKEHISPELQYIETKWASYMSFNKTSDLLTDVLPIASTHNGASVRNHVHKFAKQLKQELEGKPVCISGCANEWAKLPKPDKPLTVGIDGGYVRDWQDKRSNFEVIVGKSFSKTKTAKRFGLVQSMDERPQRRLLDVLRHQEIQANQQITFLSDGAENVRDLQFIMHPEAEHVLDWFHLTMRFTVLNQFAKGLKHSDLEMGNKIIKTLESAKWYTWHGNVEKALESLEESQLICDNNKIKYKNRKKMLNHLEELMTYIKNNSHIIPNYGEKWRYGETIASSFVESTVNEVVTKRMVKKQQMQWTQEGAHYLLQARTATLNGEIASHFERWYPGLKINNDTDNQSIDFKQAA